MHLPAVFISCLANPVLRHLVVSTSRTSRQYSSAGGMSVRAIDGHRKETVVVGSHQYPSFVMHAPPPPVAYFCEPVLIEIGIFPCISPSTSPNRLFGTWRIPLWPSLARICQADGWTLDWLSKLPLTIPNHCSDRSSQDQSRSSLPKSILLSTVVRLLLPFTYCRSF